MLSFLSPPLLYLSVLCLSCHSPVAALSCRIGTPSQCETATVVPGHDLVGEGFDVITLQRKAYVVGRTTSYPNPNGTCKLCHNSLNQNELQKVPDYVVDWMVSTQCQTKLFSSSYTSVSSLMDNLASQDGHNFGVIGLNLGEFSIVLDVGGTRSNVYNFAKARSREDRYFFSIHSITCKHYSYRVQSSPPLSSEFKKDLDRLPRVYNSSTRDQYMKLIETYGTHYIHKVELGGRFRRVTAARTCLSTLNGLTSSEVQSCLAQGIAVGLGEMTLTGIRPNCHAVLHNRGLSTSYSSGLHQHITEVTGGTGWSGEFSLTQSDSEGYRKWLDSLKTNPNIVSHSITPVYELVSDKVKRDAVEAAVDQYIQDNVRVSLHREPPTCGSSSGLANNCCPKEAWRGRLEVTIVRAWGLDGDYYYKPTDAYVKMWYGSIYRKTHMIESDNPRWNTRFDLGQVNTLPDLRIEVWDEDFRYDDKLISCEIPVKQGSWISTCGRTSGVEVEYTLTCEPHLTGDYCHRYKPSPEASCFQKSTLKKNSAMKLSCNVEPLSNCTPSEHVH